MAEPLVVLEDVEMAAASGRAVFSGLSFALPRGARVRLAVERGEGASALLRLCAGLAHPQKGRVVLDGVPLVPDRFDHPYIARGKVGWVPHEGALLANLTLLQNVALPLRFVSGVPRAEAEERALAALGELGIADRAGQRPHALVRRERHLGALARSLAMRAELWLWDRPLEELEPGDLDRALPAMRELLLLPVTTLLVVGDDPSCARFAPAVARLSGGRLHLEGTA